MRGLGGVVHHVVVVIVGGHGGDGWLGGRQADGHVSSST